MGYEPLAYFKGPSSLWSRIIPDLSVTIERMYVYKQLKLSYYRKRVVEYVVDNV